MGAVASTAAARVATVDLFYYGTQDVPVPPRRVRPPAPRSRSFLCESCRSAVPHEDLERGTASEVFGLVLCGECQSRFHGEDRVELYFCGECGVSVPVFRVETGEALEGDGRVLCIDCRAARRSPRLKLLLLAAAAALLVVSWLLRPAPAVPPSGPESVHLLGDLLSPELPDPVPPDRIDALERHVEELVERAETMDRARRRALSAIADAGAGLFEIRADFDQRISDLGALRERIAAQADEVSSRMNPLNPPADDSR